MIQNWNTLLLELKNEKVFFCECISFQITPRASVLSHCENKWNLAAIKIKKIRIWNYILNYSLHYTHIFSIFSDLLVDFNVWSLNVRGFMTPASICWSYWRKLFSGGWYTCIALRSLSRTSVRVGLGIGSPGSWHTLSVSIYFGTFRPDTVCMFFSLWCLGKILDYRIHTSSFPWMVDACLQSKVDNSSDPCWVGRFPRCI